MMYCPACGKKYETGKFCLDDGTKLVEESKQSAPAEKTKCVCPKCGAVLPVGSKFCDKCGAPITQAEEKAVEDETGESDPDYKKGEEAYDKKDYETAVKWFKKAVETDEDNASALLALGTCYYLGNGVEENDEKAKEYYEKAAELGNSYAQYALGNVAHGEEDYKTAVKWYKKAIETDENNAAALYSLGDCYWYGNGIEEDKDKAKEYYEKAAELGDSDAQYNLGYIAFEEEDYKTAIKWDKKAIETNEKNANALGLLGVCYENGNGVGKDVAKAKELLNKAMELGNNNAIVELGTIAYENEKYELAKKYFKKALKNDEKDINALYWFGTCMRDEENDLEAQKYFEMAADLGDVRSQSELGFLALRNNNYETAVRFFRKAIDTNDDDAEALFGLGYCYRNGKGVTENEDRAVNYFQRAADLGFQAAQDALDHKPGFLEKLSNIVDEKIADLLS